MRFDDEKVKVDVSAFNSARTWQLYGTYVRLGDDTPERPHREARLLEAEPTLEVVPNELLDSAAAWTAPVPTPEPSGGPAAGNLDVDSWLAACASDAIRPQLQRDGRRPSPLSRLMLTPPKPEDGTADDVPDVFEAERTDGGTASQRACGSPPNAPIGHSEAGHQSLGAPEVQPAGGGSVMADEPIYEILDRLAGVKEGASGWRAVCPAHQDSNPSLSISEGDDGRVLLHCFAGCEVEDIVAELGLTMRDLFPRKSHQGEPDGDQDQLDEDNNDNQPREHAPVTVASLAADKGLDAQYLWNIGLRDLPNGVVSIPYWDSSGGCVEKLRTALKAKDGSRWPQGVPLMAYGIDRLQAAREAGYLVLVEGESDCWTLWFEGYPALGIPGASATKVLEAEHLVGVNRIYTVQEPDRGGTTFVAGIKKRLQDLGWKGDAVVVRLDGAKDAKELYRLDPANFYVAFQQALKAAQPLKSAVTSSRAGIVRLEDVRAELVSWLWKGRIPFGKVTIVDGDPGLGKSVMTIDLAARVTTCRAMPGESAPALPGPAGVVLLSAEDGLADTIKPRLEAAGADMSRVVALTYVIDREGERLPLLSDLAEIEEAIRQVDAKLVFIDPVMAYMDGSTNTYRDQDMRRLLAPLAALAERTGVAIVVIRHLNKNSGGNPLYRGGGSIGIIGAARSALLVAKDPDDLSGNRRILASTKCNLAAPPPALVYHLEEAQNGAVRVVWDGVTEHTAASLLAVPASGEERSSLDAARNFLSDMLAGGPKPVKSILSEAKAAGIAERTLERGKAALGVKAIKVSAPGQDGYWTWELMAKAAKTVNSGSVAVLAAFDADTDARLQDVRAKMNEYHRQRQNPPPTNQ